MIEFFFFMNLLHEMTCPNLTVGRKLVFFYMGEKEFYVEIQSQWNKYS